MEYDAADRTTKITYPAAGSCNSPTTPAGGASIDRSRRLHGQLPLRCRRPAGGTDRRHGQRLVRYQYDAAGRLASETRGNGTSTTYEYDAAGQLLHLVHRARTAVLSRFDYIYDDNGRRTSMTTLEGTTEYVYDAAGQLILVALPGGRIIRYEYDAAGNRREINDNGVTTAYTVNEMNQYLAVGATSQGSTPTATWSPGPARRSRRVTPMMPRGACSAL